MNVFQYREAVKYCLADFFHRNHNIKHNDKNGEKKMFWIGRPSIKLLLRPMTTTTKPFVIGPQLCQLLNFAFMIRSLESDCWTVKIFVTIIILIPPLCHQMVCECEKDLSSLFFSQGRWTGSKSETGESDLASSNINFCQKQDFSDLVLADLFAEFWPFGSSQEVSIRSYIIRYL